MKIIIKENTGKTFGASKRKELEVFLNYLKDKQFVKTKGPKIIFEFSCYREVQEFLKFSSNILLDTENGKNLVKISEEKKNE